MFFKESSMTMEEIEEEAPVTVRVPPRQEYAIGQKVIVTSVLTGFKEEQAEIIKVLGAKEFNSDPLFMLVFDDGRKTYRRSDRLRAVTEKDQPELKLDLSSEQFEDEECMEVEDSEIEEALPPTVPNPPVRILFTVGQKVMAHRHARKFGPMEKARIVSLSDNLRSNKVIAHIKFNSGGSTYRLVEDLTLLVE